MAINSWMDSYLSTIVYIFLDQTYGFTVTILGDMHVSMDKTVILLEQMSQFCEIEKGS